MAKQERLISKLGKASAQAGRFRGELEVSAEAVSGLGRRVEALCGGVGGLLGGGEGELEVGEVDGDAGLVETLDARSCTAVVEDRDDDFW